MKKGILLIVCSLLLVTGCGKEKTTECTYSGTKSGVEITGTYTIKSTGKYVDSIELSEKYVHSDANMLNTLKTNVETLNANYKDLDGFEFSATIEDGAMLYSTKTDFSKLDMDEYIKINPAIEDALVNKKIRLVDLVATYESQSATCKEK